MSLFVFARESQSFCRLFLWRHHGNARTERGRMVTQCDKIKVGRIEISSSSRLPFFYNILSSPSIPPLVNASAFVRQSLFSSICLYVVFVEFDLLISHAALRPWLLVDSMTPTAPINGGCAVVCLGLVLLPWRLS